MVFGRIHYILVPVFYGMIALAGRVFTARGLGLWYETLLKPAYTPPGWLISMVWLGIYFLTALSLISFINAARSSPGFGTVLRLYILNGILNAAWSYIFFVLHLLGPAVLAAAFIAGSVVMIIILARAYAYMACLLLLPYFVWATFATRLAYDIFMLNR